MYSNDISNNSKQLFKIQNYQINLHSKINIFETPSHIPLFFVNNKFLGSDIHGTIGIFATLITLFAKYIDVGVLEVLETPTSIISASFKSLDSCPSSWAKVYCIAPILSKYPIDKLCCLPGLSIAKSYLK